MIPAQCLTYKRQVKGIQSAVPVPVGTGRVLHDRRFAEKKFLQNRCILPVKHAVPVDIAGNGFRRLLYFFSAGEEVRL